MSYVVMIETNSKANEICSSLTAYCTGRACDYFYYESYIEEFTRQVDSVFSASFDNINSECICYPTGRHVCITFDSCPTEEQVAIINERANKFSSFYEGTTVKILGIRVVNTNNQELAYNE